MTQSSLLFLNTKDAIDPTTPHDATFVLVDILPSRLSQYKLSIATVEIPNLVYPINDNTDQVYFAENGGGTITISLTQQNYTGSQLATELATQMTASTGIAEVYTGTYDAQTKKITIVPTNPLNSITWIDGANSADEVTGFSTFNTPIIGGGVAPDSIRLDGSQYLDLITNLATSNYSSNSRGNTLYRVPLLVPYGNISFHTNSTDDFLQISSNSMHSVNIRLYDDKDRLFVLPSNCACSYVLKLTPIY